MASIVYNPSNQQPDSVSVKTGSYTIPAGYYAQVTASVQGTDTFSIGGVVALEGIAAGASGGTSSDIAAINVENLLATTASYTVPSGYKAFIRLACSNATSPTINIGSYNFTLSGPFFTDQYIVGSGMVISMVESSSSTRNIVGAAERIGSQTSATSPAAVSGTFWVSAGTLLNTSGGSYTVTLYKNIS